MRIMYDSVTAQNIPRDAQMVAGYVDGKYAWTQADWDLFPNAIHVPIAVFATTNGGKVLDVEPYNATPAEAVGWVQRARAHGIDPTIYCGYGTNGYSWALVIDAFITAKVPEPHYWVAAYPGNGAKLYPGTVAHQYANLGPYDISVVADYWPGIDSLSEVINMLTPEEISAIATAVWQTPIFDRADGTKVPAWTVLNAVLGGNATGMPTRFDDIKTDTAESRRMVGGILGWPGLVESETIALAKLESANVSIDIPALAQNLITALITYLKGQAL